MQTSKLIVHGFVETVKITSELRVSLVDNLRRLACELGSVAWLTRGTRVLGLSWLLGREAGT